VAVEVALADHLGIDRWAGVVGGSMGGMRVLEWCVGHPTGWPGRRAGRRGRRHRRQIALCSLQIRAIRADPAFAGGDYYGPGRPVDGMALARGIGQISYRTGASSRAVRHGAQGRRTR
jgi:homoserine O-acetyltransferase